MPQRLLPTRRRGGRRVEFADVKRLSWKTICEEDYEDGMATAT